MVGVCGRGWGGGLISTDPCSALSLALGSLLACLPQRNYSEKCTDYGSVRLKTVPRFVPRSHGAGALMGLCRGLCRKTLLEEDSFLPSDKLQLLRRKDCFGTDEEWH